MVGSAAWASYARRVTEPTATNGKAGTSARREGERRKAKREAAVRARHPRIGGVILALQDAPQHERSWSRGAGGEELVKQALTKHAPDVAVLHDRRIPGSRANIDHIAITATGVWVIDTELPLFGTPPIRGLSIFARRGLARQLNASGGVTADGAATLAAALAQRFPQA